MSERFPHVGWRNLNPTVGDLAANADTARAASGKKARDAGADMIAFPEMFLTGYQASGPGEETRLRDGCAPGHGRACRDLHRRSGHRDRRPAARRGQAVSNAYYVRSGRRNLGDRAQAPPVRTYNVFDEKRYYHSGDPGRPGARRSASYRRADLRGRVVRGRDRNAGRDKGPEILLVPNGSPYHRGQNGLFRQAQIGGAAWSRRGLPLVLPEPLGRTGRPGLRRGEASF